MAEWINACINKKIFDTLPIRFSAQYEFLFLLHSYCKRIELRNQCEPLGHGIFLKKWTKIIYMRYFLTYMYSLACMKPSEAKIENFIFPPTVFQFNHRRMLSYKTI